MPALTSRPESSDPIAQRRGEGPAEAAHERARRQATASAKRAAAKKSGGVSLTPALAAIQVEPQISDMTANSR